MESDGEFIIQMIGKEFLLMFMVAGRMCCSLLVTASRTCGCMYVLHHLEFEVIFCILSHRRIAGICSMSYEFLSIFAFCCINKPSLLLSKSCLASPVVYLSF
jgi:hypothetical protein